jgi:transposase
VLLDRQRDLALPQVSDIFGKRGMKYLSQAQLGEPDSTLLRQDLDVLHCLETEILEMERFVVADSAEDEYVRILQTVPGLGLILSNVIGSEIDRVERFCSASKLCAYSGLVPTTQSSGGKYYHGGVLRRCNKWLKWAFIEASWVAIGCSAYFAGLYRYHKSGGKHANEAIVAVARRMCRIVWHLLREGRAYEARGFIRDIPGRSRSRLTVPC